MGFSDQQVNALRRKLNENFVHSREVQGRTLSYIEGWHAIAEANRIFGFDGWDRETVETKCVLGRENRGSYHAVYVAKVRLTVRAEDRVVVREGHGTGEAHGGSAGETHERALKTAETDATKRALATFGKPFGLSLYISTVQSREATFNPVRTPPIAETDRRRTAQKIGANGRYYVPSRSRSPLDPVLVEATKCPAQANGQQPDLNADAPPVHLETSPMACDALPASETPASMEPEYTSSVVVETSRSGFSASSEDASAAAPPTAPSLQPGSLDSAAASSSQIAERSGLQRLFIDWPKRRREPAHLEFVRSQPCLLCGRTPSDAHHLKFAQPRAMSRKVSDEFTVPLCRMHHRQVHLTGNEAEWWTVANPGVDPLQIARQLWEESQGTRADPADGPDSFTK